MELLRMVWNFGLVFLMISVTRQSYITRFENRQYSGIVVSIHEEVPENPRIVEQLKEIFINASEALYKATHKRAFFADVVIEIPQTWSAKQWYQYAPGKSLFSSASFRIAKEHPKFKDNPYTLQAGGCHEQGQYIHLTPAFILNKDGEMSEKFGNLAKQIVHEWAHYRYGVFDEYGEVGSEKYPTFYIDDSGNVRPTSCQKDIEGWVSSSDGGPCTILEGEFLPDDDCRFIPYEDQNNATSSLMYSAFLPTIDQFCDDSPKTLHNINARNKHNNLCEGKPVWEVISNNADFSNQKVPNDDVDTTEPKFRVIHRRKNEKRTFVLALDVSGSMRTNNKILTLRATASRFIHHRIQDGSYLGIVSFSKETEQLLAVTQVDKETRKLMARHLPRETYSETAIGKALLESIEMLQWRSPEGAVIVLITDGEENIDPSISMVLPRVIESKVIVNTVAIGTKASEQLENLAAQTGGKVYYFPDHTDSTAALDEAFIALSTDDSETLMIMSESVAVSKTKPAEREVVIDQTVGVNAKFLFTGKNIKNVDVTLTDPSGKIYSTGSNTGNFHESTKSLVFNVEDAKAGIWKYKVEDYSHVGDKFDVSLTTEPRDKEPIKIKTWILNQQVRFPQKAVIFAEIHKAEKPVIKATVKAFVTGPSGNRVNISLHDGGVGADIDKDDGIYTGYFIAYEGNGRYSVSVTAKNNGEAFLIERPVGSAAPPIPDVPNIKKVKEKQPKKCFSLSEFKVVKEARQDRQQEVVIPAVHFERASVVGSFKLSDWDIIEAGQIAPTRVTDLDAMYVLEDGNNKIVTLKWTTPLDGANAQRDLNVDIRASGSQEQLNGNFAEGYRIQKSDITQNSSMDQSYYRYNNFTVKLPPNVIPGSDKHSLMNIYFALKHYDFNGNIAEMSNVAYVTVGMSPVKLKITPPSPIDSGNMPKIVGVAAACVIGSLLLALGVVMIHRACKNSEQNDFEDSY